MSGETSDFAAPTQIKSPGPKDWTGGILGSSELRTIPGTLVTDVGAGSESELHCCCCEKNSISTLGMYSSIVIEFMWIIHQYQFQYQYRYQYVYRYQYRYHYH